MGLALGSTTKLVRDQLAIDVLSVEAGKGSDGMSKPQITVGKRLTRDLMVLYRASLAAKPDENVNEVQLDYSLTRWLNLEARFGDAARGNLDLLFRWRY